MASKLAPKPPSTAAATVTSSSADGVKQILHVPHRADMLLFTLCKSINTLTKDLGDPFVMHMRMVRLEQKDGDSKLAAALRCKLNTILLGRVGLNNGRAHINKLIGFINYIKDNYKGQQTVPDRVRTDIGKLFDPIFTSHRQPDYKSLLREYIELWKSGKLPDLTFDTTLTLSDCQEESASTGVAAKQKPAAIRAKIKAVAEETAKKRKADCLSITEQLKIWNDKCKAALKAILKNMPKTESDFGEASMFWSRECEKLLIKIVEHSESLNGFQVQLLPLMSLAQKSQLSSAMCVQLRALLSELCNRPKKQISKKVQEKEQPSKAKKQTK